MPHPPIDLRKKQPWLMVPKAAMDALDDPYLGYPGELPVKEAGDEILALTESSLAKVLLGRGHGLGMLYGYRREIERRTKEEGFREGIAFATNVLRRFANRPEDTEEWRLAGGRRTSRQR